MKLNGLNLEAVRYVVDAMRPADRHELSATHRGDVLDPAALADEIAYGWGGTGMRWLVTDDDHLPVAVFGAAQPWRGLWSCYLIATPDFPKVALGLTRFAKRVFIPYMMRHANRIEARSIDGHTEAHRWLRLLGATEESRMRGYGRRGEDFIVFTLAIPAGAGIVDKAD